MQTVKLNIGEGTGVEIGDYVVRLAIDALDDGTPVITLAGENCDLMGEMPGEYEVRPLGTLQAQFAPEAS